MVLKITPTLTSFQVLLEIALTTNSGSELSMYNSAKTLTLLRNSDFESTFDYLLH